MLPTPFQINKAPVPQNPTVPTLQSNIIPTSRENGTSQGQCNIFSETDIVVDLDFASLLATFSNGLVMENGQLRFPLPESPGIVKISAAPVLSAVNSSSFAAGPISFVIGKASLALSSNSSYKATIAIPPSNLLAVTVLNPTFTGLYKITAKASSSNESNSWLDELESIAFEGLFCNPIMLGGK